MRVRFFDEDKFNIMVVDEVRYDKSGLNELPAFILYKENEIEGYIPVDCDLISESRLDEIFNELLTNGYLNFAVDGFGSYVWSGDVDEDYEEGI